MLQVKFVGFFKREGRPSEKETLTRSFDGVVPLRPLFPEAFYNEVQVVATVLSSDPEIDRDSLRQSLVHQQQYCLVFHFWSIRCSTCWLYQ